MNEIGEYIQSKIADVCKQSVKEADRIILEYMAKRNNNEYPSAKRSGVYKIRRLYNDGPAAM